MAARGYHLLSIPFYEWKLLGRLSNYTATQEQQQQRWLEQQQRHQMEQQQWMGSEPQLEQQDDQKGWQQQQEGRQGGGEDLSRHIDYLKAGLDAACAAGVAAHLDYSVVKANAKGHL